MQILPITTNNHDRISGLGFSGAASWAERRAEEAGRVLSEVRQAYREGRASAAEVRSAENARATAVSCCEKPSYDKIDKSSPSDYKGVWA